MQRLEMIAGLSLLWLSLGSAAQSAGPIPLATANQASASPALPDPKSLLQEVEQNQKRLESLAKDYTYHVHTDEQELDKHGGVKKTETEDAESITIDGIRVNRVVARNGKPLSPGEQQKESDRIDKEVARAKERRDKVRAKGGETDEHGDEVLPLSRLLELGSFSNPRREVQNGRPLLLLDYTGSPQAKTHSAFEGIVRSITGTVSIDEADRVMTAAQGHFVNDFKLGGGLLADVRKGTSFTYGTTRVSDGVWLPADISGQGTIRLLLFANFNGRLHLTTSDYRRFRTSATIIGSNGIVGPEDGRSQDAPPPSPPSSPQHP